MGRAKSHPASASDRGETTTRRGGRHIRRGGGDGTGALASLALLRNGELGDGASVTKLWGCRRST